MKNFKLMTGYIPGVIGRISELHALYYSEHWNFGKFFEAKVATELSTFLNDFNEKKDRIFSLSIDGRIEGSISIDGSSENGNIAHLRWFIISDKLRGKGAGNELMQQAMKFCEQNGYRSVYLWTFQGLNSARHLYEKYGFSLSEERTGKQWGAIVTEQRFNKHLGVNMGIKYFENLTEGEHLRCQSISITKESIIDFAKTFDPQPFHIDEKAANDSIFNGLVASSLHTLSACTRVVVEAQGELAILSGVGMHETKMFNPVRPGDTLSIEAWWTELQISNSKPDRGFASIKCKVVNQRKEPIIEYGYRYLIACKG